jgi:peptidoglycan-N-acetylglucosamine deacetylase
MRQVVTSGAAVLLLIVAVGVVTHRDRDVTVTVDGRSLVVPHGDTVARVLTAAGLHRHDGTMWSVLSHRPLDRHADRAVVWRNGAPAGPGDRVAGGDRLTLVNGVDRVEPVVERQVIVPSGGLPPVEDTVWRAPVPGIDDVVAGARSDEVVRTVTVRAPVPAAPVPGNVVALTFDDGPDPRYTPTLLQILHDEGVHATFCIVAHVARRHPEIVRAIAAGGHTLCDHTEHHLEHLDRHPLLEVHNEMLTCSDFIFQVTGQRPAIFRAPGGNLSPMVIDEAHRQGMRVLGWDVDPADYIPQPPPVLLDRVIHHIRPGSVVLMHDGGGNGGNTVSMVQELIHELRFFGFTFATP